MHGDQTRRPFFELAPSYSRGILSCYGISDAICFRRAMSRKPPGLAKQRQRASSTPAFDHIVTVHKGERRPEPYSMASHFQNCVTMNRLNSVFGNAPLCRRLR